MPLYMAPLVKSAVAAGVGLGVLQHSLGAVRHTRGALHTAGALHCPQSKTPRPTLPPGVHTSPATEEGKGDKANPFQEKAQGTAPARPATPCIPGPVVSLGRWGLRSVTSGRGHTIACMVHGGQQRVHMTCTYDRHIG